MDITKETSFVEFSQSVFHLLRNFKSKQTFLKAQNGENSNLLLNKIYFPSGCLLRLEEIKENLLKKWETGRIMNL